MNVHFIFFIKLFFVFFGDEFVVADPTASIRYAYQRCRRKKKVEQQVLRPGEPFDDTAAGTGDIRKRCGKELTKVIKREKPYQYQGAIKP